MSVLDARTAAAFSTAAALEAKEALRAGGAPERSLLARAPTPLPDSSGPPGPSSFALGAGGLGPGSSSKGAAGAAEAAAAAEDIQASILAAAQLARRSSALHDMQVEASGPEEELLLGDDLDFSFAEGLGGDKALSPRDTVPGAMLGGAAAAVAAAPSQQQQQQQEQPAAGPAQPAVAAAPAAMPPQPQVAAAAAVPPPQLLAAAVAPPVREPPADGSDSDIEVMLAKLETMGSALPDQRPSHLGLAAQRAQPPWQHQQQQLQQQQPLQQLWHEEPGGRAGGGGDTPSLPSRSQTPSLPSLILGDDGEPEVQQQQQQQPGLDAVSSRPPEQSAPGSTAAAEERHPSGKDASGAAAGSRQRSGERGGSSRRDRSGRAGGPTEGRQKEREEGRAVGGSRKESGSGRGEGGRHHESKRGREQTEKERRRSGGEAEDQDRRRRYESGRSPGPRLAVCLWADGQQRLRNLYCSCLHPCSANCQLACLAFFLSSTAGYHNSRLLCWAAWRLLLLGCQCLAWYIVHSQLLPVGFIQPDR